MSEQNKIQIGGDHYKTGGEEHWDRVARLGLDYFQGQITKYVERWKKKAGIQDLQKARHFLDKYIELNTLQEKVRVEEPSGHYAGLDRAFHRAFVADGAGPGSSYVNQDQTEVKQVTAHDFQQTPGMEGTLVAPADLCHMCGRKAAEHKWGPTGMGPKEQHVG